MRIHIPARIYYHHLMGGYKWRFNFLILIAAILMWVYLFGYPHNVGVWLNRLLNVPFVNVPYVNGPPIDMPHLL